MPSCNVSLWEPGDTTVPADISAAVNAVLPSPSTCDKYLAFVPNGSSVVATATLALLLMAEQRTINWDDAINIRHNDGWIIVLPLN